MMGALLGCPDFWGLGNEAFQAERQALGAVGANSKLIDK
jgi:hypothetical protein